MPKGPGTQALRTAPLEICSGSAGVPDLPTALFWGFPLAWTILNQGVVIGKQPLEGCYEEMGMHTSYGHYRRHLGVQ